tara:strand:- start:27 stop:248 length:222 start_codon:yes stop_codon:yes gene_type:complete
MVIDDKTGEADVHFAAKQLSGRAILDLLRMVFVIWPERRRQRRHLGALSDHYLRDIGVTRCQARQEVSRWFFD